MPIDHDEPAVEVLTTETGSAAATPAPPREHVDLVCDGEHERSCMFCDGGLFACTVCGAFEGATPDECPGVPMTPEQSDAVYAGTLNYRAGAWRPGECCAVMRPVHRRDEFMAEHGYRREPATDRWVRIDGAADDPQ